MKVLVFIETKIKSIYFTNMFYSLVFEHNGHTGHYFEIIGLFYSTWECDVAKISYFLSNFCIGESKCDIDNIEEILIQSEFHTKILTELERKRLNYVCDKYVKEKDNISGLLYSDFHNMKNSIYNNINEEDKNQLLILLK